MCWHLPGIESQGRGGDYLPSFECEMYILKIFSLAISFVLTTLLKRGYSIIPKVRLKRFGVTWFIRLLLKISNFWWIFGIPLHLLYNYFVHVLLLMDVYLFSFTPKSGFLKESKTNFVSRWQKTCMYDTQHEILTGYIRLGKG